MRSRLPAAAFLPDFELTAAAGYVAPTLLGNPIGVFALGGNVLAPLVNGGRLQAQQQIVAARRDQASFNYRRAALVAFREVDDALAAVRRLDEQEHTIVLQRVALAQSLQLATNRYRAGYSPYLEQLDAQRGLHAADLVLVQVRGDRLTAVVTVFQALGGGWSSAKLEANAANEQLSR
ncbi:TolC family protein [Polymorphobacter sp. PAMC 29334]|uniref:TolC family protein n=1 Tax=Polymorphobacter sp. PAMC 29334 TaxID=2862331 RepID=UPI001C7792D7|nr:TolC family protein [Polymorphobacter sp. PAMC 29334]QYE34588.1 TolC family protein [Polymorphobacter sp. PAMC 29334]